LITHTNSCTEELIYNLFGFVGNHSQMASRPF
jgi:hypothetical protein